MSTSTTVFGEGATIKPATGNSNGFSFPGFNNASGGTTPSTGFQFSTPAATATTSAGNTSSTFSFGAPAGDKPLFGNSPKFSFSDLAKQTSNDKSTSNGTEQRGMIDWSFVQKYIFSLCF